ncbi:YlxR family protein [Nocardioides sp. DS6]|uniref:YlxR family protein n=1 Tax=Nocardioides eburneus TaxID=3231482 RepID=A0ABV3SVK3_9ACTN
MARQDFSSQDGPVRTCVGCRKRAAKRELLRVTAGSGPDGQTVVVPDPSATAPGRGAHLHPTKECYELAVRRKAFTRALRLAGGSSSAPVGDYLDQRTDEHRPLPAAD